MHDGQQNFWGLPPVKTDGRLPNGFGSTAFGKLQNELTVTLAYRRASACFARLTVHGMSPAKVEDTSGFTFGLPSLQLFEAACDPSLFLTKKHVDLPARNPVGRFDEHTLCIDGKMHGFKAASALQPVRKFGIVQTHRMAVGRGYLGLGLQSATSFRLRAASAITTKTIA